VENSIKIRKNSVQKVVDLSIFADYNRDSSWTKMLSKNQKQKYFSQK